jgi:hypothetical protein
MVDRPTSRHAIVVDGSVIGTLALAWWIVDENVPTAFRAITVARARLLLANHLRLSRKTRQVLQLRVDYPAATLAELAELAGLTEKRFTLGLYAALAWLAPVPRHGPVPEELANELREAHAKDPEADRRRQRTTGDVFGRPEPPPPPPLPASLVEELARLWPASVKAVGIATAANYNAHVASCQLNIWLAQLEQGEQTVASLAEALGRPPATVRQRINSAARAVERLAYLQSLEGQLNIFSRRTAPVDRPTPPAPAAGVVADLDEIGPRLRRMWAAARRWHGEVDSDHLTVYLDDLVQAGYRPGDLARAAGEQTSSVSSRVKAAWRARERLGKLPRLDSNQKPPG